MANIVLNVVRNKKFKVDYVYSDLQVPVRRDNTTKDVVSAKDLAAIKSAIKNLFYWKKGERILLPEFGNDLHSTLYKIMNNVTEENLRAAVVNIFRWEPRVVLNNIKINSDFENKQYNVTVEYTIPAINLTDNYTVSVRIQ